MSPIIKRCTGINIPLFSLRSRNSFGIGEFLDLKLLIDWAALAGLKIIQLLPINDTFDKGYPYSMISSFALNPIYLHLGAIVDLPETHPWGDPKLDYKAVFKKKWELLHHIYAIVGKEYLLSSEYKAFFKKNQEWLKPYAEYCQLRDEAESPDFYYFLQFHADKQLTEVKKYAEEKGILLKGDLSMGLDSKSVEAKLFPQYFRFNKVMGAPPDFYNALGQKWGFPSYDFEKIKEDGFIWLTSRLKRMESYFDLARLDHVLGYFRLWEIDKKDKVALKGIFYPSIPYKKADLNGFEHLFLKDHDLEDAYHPKVDMKISSEFRVLSKKDQDFLTKLFDDYFLERQEEIWKKGGKEKLLAMQMGTDLFLCVEDIGVIPKCVGGVLRELKIPSLHVQRMPKSFELEFEDTKDFPTLSVCTPSNHDMPTLRQWWEEDEETTKRYYNQILKKEGDPPKKLTGKLTEKIIEEHLQSPAKIAIFLMQDLFAMDEQLRHPDPDYERINDPSHPKGCWSWRMHLYLEELLLDRGFTDRVRMLVDNSSRVP